MNYRNKLDNIYAKLINQFEDDKDRMNVFELIDELQDKIEYLTPKNK